MSVFDFGTIQVFDELVNTIQRLKISHDLELIRQAYIFAEDKHKDQVRQNGQRAITHVLTVANYIAQLKLDSVSIVAAILHDVPEKCDVEIDEIDRLFGTEVAFIVDGINNVRKFSKNISGENSDREALKNLIFNATEDIRILIIRIAEKLHNLKTLTDKTSDLAKKAASRALLIYAPISEYLGLSAIQRELEDLSFGVLYPEEYDFIIKKINEYFDNTKGTIEKFEIEFGELLTNYKVEHTFYSRKKGAYSAYKKIKNKYVDRFGGFNDKSFSKLMDVYAARVIVNTVEECYMVLGLIQSNYEVVQEEFKDYIVDPKPNGYRSIHCILKYQFVTFEIQIRTKEMHEFNEFGPASHIAYKLNDSGKAKDLTWTKDLVKWKDNTDKEIFKLKAFSNSIFVFTPKGLVIRLEKDSTPIDFAFRVHTQIGTNYKGAIVNGKIVNMQYKLQTGDVVEVLTQSKPNVSLDWVKIAKMNYTKNRIKRAISNLK